MPSTIARSSRRVNPIPFLWIMWSGDPLPIPEFYEPEPVEIVLCEDVQNGASICGEKEKEDEIFPVRHE
jgi:hypothetical protein